MVSLKIKQISMDSQGGSFVSHLRAYGLISLPIQFILMQWGMAYGQGPPPAKVVVSEAVNHQMRDRIVLIGTAQPWRSSTVAAEVEGKVEELLARRGKKMKKGDIIARLSRSELLFEIDAAKASRNAIRARLMKAREDLSRAEQLIQSQGISDRDYRHAGLSVQELEENLIEAEADVRRLQDLLEKKAVRAPFDGVITSELTEIGQWVMEGGGIVHMVDLSQVRVLVDIPEKYILGVQEQEEALVSIGAVDGQQVSGRIHALIPEGDREARVFPLEIHVKNPGEAIKAGMLARVEFPLGLNRRAVLVHKDSVITRGARSYLFAVEEGKAKQVFVTTFQSSGDYIEIQGSVRPGEMVIIRGNERVRNGQAVEIVPLGSQE